jgi:hypothetical protein
VFDLTDALTLELIKRLERNRAYEKPARVQE